MGKTVMKAGEPDSARRIREDWHDGEPDPRLGLTVLGKRTRPDRLAPDASPVAEIDGDQWQTYDSLLRAGFCLAFEFSSERHEGEIAELIDLAVAVQRRMSLPIIAWPRLADVTGILFAADPEWLKQQTPNGKGTKRAK